MSESTLAAIDIGSNAMRIAIGTVTPSGKFLILKKVREPVRLGHDVFLDGKVSPATIERSIRAFEKFAKLMKKHKVDRYRAVATSAMREAKNAPEIRQTLEKMSGLKLETISGTEEGQLIHLAVCKEINTINKSLMLIDIGGGSVEVSFSKSGELKSTKSFPLGTVRLLEKIIKSKHKESDLKNAILTELTDAKNYIDSQLNLQKPTMAIGTGGNLECLGKLKLQILKKTPNTTVTNSEITQIFEKLISMPFAERVEKLDLRKDRADVIIPATLVVNELLNFSGLEKLVIPYVGLRDGLLWSMLERK